MEAKNSRLTENMEVFQAQKVDYSRYEVSFRRWLVCEIDSGRMSLQDAIKRFDLSKYFERTFKDWQKKYSEKFHLSLQTMTSEELAQLKKLEARNKELEKQLQDAQFKNIALETIIDIAEKDLKISIRKKFNTKQ